jgi:DEAD/DEAH box helicase domain-containing protein
VLKQHLVCAALEHPLSLLHDEKYFGSSLSNALMSLKNKGDLSFDPSRDSSARIWSYIGHEVCYLFKHLGLIALVRNLYYFYI